MPELPEVQTTVNGLNQSIKDKTITDVWSDYHLRTKNKNKNSIKSKKYFNLFRKELVREKIINVERRGKNILIHLTHNKTILVHMKMTGHFLYGRYVWQNKKWKTQDKHLSDPFNKFIHLIFTLSDGKHLAFSDMRKFAKVIFFETSKRNTVADLATLGPEPLLNVSLDVFKKQLFKKANGKIKTVLMDQTVVVGIGNIYSDEILWHSGIHPERTVSTLNDKDIKSICKATEKILTTSIKMGGDSMSDYRNIEGKKGNFQNSHRAYRKTGERCLQKNCLGIISRKIIGGRSGHFCNIHQK